VQINSHRRPPACRNACPPKQSVGGQCRLGGVGVKWQISQPSFLLSNPSSIDNLYVVWLKKMEILSLKFQMKTKQQQTLLKPKQTFLYRYQKTPKNKQGQEKPSNISVGWLFAG